MPKENYEPKKYAIRETSYKKVPTGEMNAYGHLVYAREGKPSVKILKDTNYSSLKKDYYTRSKNSNGTMFAKFRTDYVVTPKRRLVSVTEKYQDGSKTVKYFGGCTKCKN